MTTDLMEIYNMLHEHRSNVCRLMANDKSISKNKRDKLYKYTCELQERLDNLSKNIYFDFTSYETDETIKDYIEKNP